MKKLLRLLTLLIFTLPALAEANNFFTNDEHFETPFDLTCSVSISMDSINNPAGGLLLTAEPTGEAPFAYLWSTGATTQSITFFQWGTNFCVTVTDAAGCVATECLFSNTTCSVTISGSNTGVLTANPTGVAPFTYSWSNGQATQSITPNAPGTYCVTIASSNGCTATACYQFTGGGTGSCGVEAVFDSTAAGGLAIFAAATGQAPFTYIWNTGETTPSIGISPNVASYCVTVTDATGCEASDCLSFTNPTNCSVSIEVDTMPPGTTGLQLTAIATGVAPFTYQWNVQNWQTQSISVPLPGPNGNTYCVAVTDATGCAVTTCITLPNSNCTVTITESVDPNTNQVILVAATPNSGPFLYMWNTGELTPSIVPQPTGSGNYCVTVTSSNGCTASDCHTYLAPNSSQVQGYVYIPDSINTPAILEGVVELYLLDPAGNQYSLFATTTLESIQNGWVTHYDFGQITTGTYILKISLDPASPYFADYLPTYYGNVVEWNESTVINIPSSQSFYQVTLVEDQNLTGPGGINGLLDDGEGLMSSGDDRSSPLEGISILLFDSQEEPITHTLTNANGEYSFGNLPYGTYKISVEITGLEQGVRWVTISEDNPISNGNDFEVGENGIVNGITELVAEGSLQVYPNPAKDVLNVYLEAAASFEAQLTLSGLKGKTVLMKKQNFAAGVQHIELNVSDLPAGVYFLQITTKRGVVTQKFVKK